MKYRECPVAGKPCYYYRSTNGANDKVSFACHYLLDTDRARVRGEDGKCLSWRSNRYKKQTEHREWKMPEYNGGSTLC